MKIDISINIERKQKPRPKVEPEKKSEPKPETKTETKTEIRHGVGGMQNGKSYYDDRSWRIPRTLGFYIPEDES